MNFTVKIMKHMKEKKPFFHALYGEHSHFEIFDMRKTKAGHANALPFVLDGSSRMLLRPVVVHVSYYDLPCAPTLEVHTPRFQTAFGLLGHLLRAIYLLLCPLPLLL